MADTYEDILSFEDGVLSFDLDVLLRVDANMATSYEGHKRLGFSYEPYAASVAKQTGLGAFLNNTVQNSSDLLGVKLVATSPDIGVSTSFLRGLLEPVLDFAPLDSSSHWSSNFSVDVNGRYQRATTMAVEDFLEDVRFAAKVNVAGKENAATFEQPAPAAL